MSFSVDAWGTVQVTPVLSTASTTAVAVLPQGGKPQITPTQDIETNLVSKWLPCVAFPVFRQ